MSFAPPPKDPNAHLYGQQSYGQPPAPAPHQSVQQRQPQYSGYGPGQAPPPQPPLGGYSNYSYNQPQYQQQRPNNDYDIHSQVYRPTEAEQMAHHKHHAPKPKDQKSGRLSENAVRVEKGLNSLFKKLDKKL
jgi:hypothetical protein